MRDVELDRHLLGLETLWTVRSVELNIQAQAVDVWARRGEAVRSSCPEFGTPLGFYDHSAERVGAGLRASVRWTSLFRTPSDPTVLDLGPDAEAAR